MPVRLSLLVALLELLLFTKAFDFWYWQPLENLDLANVDPVWELPNAKFYICGVDISNEVFIGSYQYPLPEGNEKCAIADSDNQSLNERDKSKIKILNFPSEKVKWHLVNKGDKVKELGSQLFSVGKDRKEDEDKFICRFKTGSVGFIGRVQPRVSDDACVAGTNGPATGTGIADHSYEILLRNQQ